MTTLSIAKEGQGQKKKDHLEVIAVIQTGNDSAVDSEVVVVKVIRNGWVLGRF